MQRFVWVGADEPQEWFRGGSYLVSRRIRMLIETWDRSALGDQEETIGRDKTEGAPLRAAREHDPVDLNAKRPDGEHVIAADAHIRLASHVTNGGVRILRRGYNYTDGIDPRTGELDAGLFFICFQQRSPHPVRRPAAAAGNDRRAQRVHPAHVQRRVRGTAGGATGWVRRRRTVHLRIPHSSECARGPRHGHSCNPGETTGPPAAPSPELQTSVIRSDLSSLRALRIGF